MPLDPGGELPISSFVECICAVHLSSYVDAPFQDRGGLMLIGAPGMLKTTLLQSLDRNYASVLELSDINQMGLTALKQQLTTGDKRTIVFLDYAKLYERNPATSSNIEGTIKALVAEGFTAAAFENAAIQKLTARAVVIGAMSERFRMNHSRPWDDSGFARRFVWSLVSLKDPQMLERAVEEWKLVSFRIAHLPPTPNPPLIPNLTTGEERRQLSLMAKWQPGPHAAQVQMLAKMLCVLKWWAQLQGHEPEQGYHTLLQFARSLGPNGAELVV